jgi:hypothetical protein
LVCLSVTEVVRKIRREVTRKMHKRSRMTRILRISENLETEGNKDSEVPARSVQIEIIFVSFVIFCGKKKRFGTGRYLGFTQATSVATDDPVDRVIRVIRG